MLFAQGKTGFLKILISKSVIITIATLLITFILIKVIRSIIKKTFTKGAKTVDIKKRNTILSLVNNIIFYVLIIIAIIIILTAWGVNVTGMVAGLGIAGVVLGLALQDALKDIIMGCNIIMDNYFVVGDLVEIDGFTGYVEEFGLKNTKVRNFEGTLLVVSNREINKVKNLSTKDTVIQINVSTAYEEKEERVKNILTNICKKIDDMELSTKQTEYCGINSLAPSSVDYLIKAHCRPDDQYALKREILGLIKRDFDKNNIKIPYQQIEVHNGK